MTRSEGHPPEVQRGAQIIESAFLAYINEFQRFTLQSRLRFESRDWAGILKDSADRLDVYSSLVDRTTTQLVELLDADTRNRGTWRAMKEAYLERVNDRTDSELGETFFNSITRRVFTTVGVDSDVEFVATGTVLPDPEQAAAAVAEDFSCTAGVRDAVRLLLRRHEMSVGYEDLEGDATRVAWAIASHLEDERVDSLQVVRAMFFRNKGAYLVGRVRTRTRDVPLAIALRNRTGRVVTDAVLLNEDDVSVVFSFTRSYYFVDAPRPASLVSFLRTIMPRKPVSEMYAAIGHNKHGKTVFYRDLLDHLAGTNEQFHVAPGARGMVMIVFTMPTFDAVFKIIRDEFAQPKSVTREEVMAKYELVFKHDRGGRLVDAQQFEHLRFDRSRFSEELVAELATQARRSVTVTDDAVVIGHLYTERKVTPLDVFMRSAPIAIAREAILDYGGALRDLAASNIFPGDLFLKNFGVTRHGRVVFYDYDELCLLTDCNFRALPPPRDEEEELAAEPWFYVGPHDVFPEEFLPFLGLAEEVRWPFVVAHEDLLRPEFWQRMQQMHRDGTVPDLRPYPASRRIR